MTNRRRAAIKFGVYGLSDVGWMKLEAERETPLNPAQGDIEDLLVAVQQVSGKPASPARKDPWFSTPEDWWGRT